MPNASVISTADPVFAKPQGTSSSQGSMFVALPKPIFVGTVSSNFVYKMRGWDTVDGAYIFWSSFGDTTTAPPTLHPVINITATKGVKTRTS